MKGHEYKMHGNCMQIYANERKMNGHECTLEKYERKMKGIEDKIKIMKGK